MPTKVYIIEVDLGISVDAITADEITTLTEQTQKDLDRAIEQAKAVQQVKQERADRQQESESKLTAAMDEAYNQLAAAGEAGLPVSTVMGIVAGHVPNTSAFTLRMKHILSGKGNPYVLDRKKVHGTPHYIFTPYNLVLSSPAASPPEGGQPPSTPPAASPPSA